MKRRIENKKKKRGGKEEEEEEKGNQPAKQPKQNCKEFALFLWAEGEERCWHNDHYNCQCLQIKNNTTTPESNQFQIFN